MANPLDKEFESIRNYLLALPFFGAGFLVMVAPVSLLAVFAFALRCFFLCLVLTAVFIVPVSDGAAAAGFAAGFFAGVLWAANAVVPARAKAITLLIRVLLIVFLR